MAGEQCYSRSRRGCRNTRMIAATREEAMADQHALAAPNRFVQFAQAMVAFVYLVGTDTLVVA